MLQKYLYSFLTMSGLIDKRQAFQVREEITDTQAWEYLRENKIKSIKEQLEQGEIKINDEIIEASGQTLLHQSIVINRYEVFLLCMLYQANVNQLTDEGMAPIHLAASLGRDKMIIELLKKGADINLKDGIGMTALQRAQLYDHEETIKLLKQYQ